jgi:hypothetical protein
VKFDTQTTGYHVDVVRDVIKRENPKATFDVGSGTHGDLLGKNASTDAGLAEPKFLKEDLGTFWNQGRVSDMAIPSQANTFNVAEAWAKSESPLSDVYTIAAWCFSSLRCE